MRLLAIVALAGLTLPSSVIGQGLREVPQRFAFVQPFSLLLGVGTVGFEFAAGRNTSVEIGGVGVYSKRDGILMYGGGPGIGIRRYFGQGQLAGLVLGSRVDGVWLRGDNRDADDRFLALGSLGQQESSIYMGIGIMMGYRWLTSSGFFLEPTAGYEFFAGPRPIVPGSRDLQDRLGLTLGLGIGTAW